MSGKYALIIANTEYSDASLPNLKAPDKDAGDLARVLSQTDACAFTEVTVLLNESSKTISKEIEKFSKQKKPADLLLLYFSGHGIKDELGFLHFAATDTERDLLTSTAIEASFITKVMDRSRSNRQILILDCCNSGAFSQGTKAAVGGSMGTSTAFESGFGRITLTASDAIQFAWEGDKVIPDTDNSLFTHFLVEGLEGKADQNGDGRITVDELFDYAYANVRQATEKQTPSKFSTKQQGEILLREGLPVTKSQASSPDILGIDFIKEMVNDLNDLAASENVDFGTFAREKLAYISQNPQIVNHEFAIRVSIEIKNLYKNANKKPFKPQPENYSDKSLGMADSGRNELLDKLVNVQNAVVEKTDKENSGRINKFNELIKLNRNTIEREGNSGKKEKTVVDRELTANMLRGLDKIQTSKNR